MLSFFGRARHATRPPPPSREPGGVAEFFPMVAEAKDHCGTASSYGHCKGQVVSSFGESKGRKLRSPITGSIPARARCAAKRRTERTMKSKKSEVLQGTLDLMILKTLHALGPLHGFGIARRIEQVSEDVLQLNEGTVYTSLLRLQQNGWITSAWGISENNRKARFYSISKRGLKQLVMETEDWKRISGVIDRVLRLEVQT